MRSKPFIDTEPNCGCYVDGACTESVCPEPSADMLDAQCCADCDKADNCEGLCPYMTTRR